MEKVMMPVKPGTVSEKDKIKLAKIGIVVIEHENPSELRLIRPSSELDNSDMLFCALKALTFKPQYGSDGDKQREQLAILLTQQIESKRASNR